MFNSDTKFKISRKLFEFATHTSSSPCLVLLELHTAEDDSEIVIVDSNYYIKKLKT
jgi:hypothetical protein